MLRLGRAPAKLNLTLELTGRRADGYHELAAVSQTIAWSDVVGVEVAGKDWRDPCRLTVSGPFGPEVPAGDQNILMRAADLLRDARRIGHISRLVLDKRVPTRSGLGGGSADAAALIRLACEGPIDDVLLKIALRCGADVPFALVGGAALLGGVGDLISPVTPLAAGVFLIALLDEVSTAAAYGAVRSEDFSSGDRSAAVVRALSAGTRPDPDLLGSALLPAALRVSPTLSDRLEALRSATPRARWSMTGSGGAFFTLLDSAEEAMEAAAAVALKLPRVLLRAVLPEPRWPDQT